MDYSVYNIDSHYDVDGFQDLTEIKFIHYWTRDEFWRRRDGRNEFGWPIGKESPLNITHYNARDVANLLKVLHYKSRFCINFQFK